MSRTFYARRVPLKVVYQKIIKLGGDSSGKKFINLKSMLKTITLGFFLSLAFVTFAQGKKNFDSLYNDCKLRELDVCLNSLKTKKNKRSSSIKNDISFYKNVERLFSGKFKKNEIKSTFKLQKFVTKLSRAVHEDSTFYEIYFYSNYTSGTIYLIYKKNELKSRGLVTKSGYTFYCDTNEDFVFSTIDFEFFSKYIVPIFFNYRITEACENFVVEDGRNLSKIFMHL
jgi:hypothetical protein